MENGGGRIDKEEVSLRMVEGGGRQGVGRYICSKTMDTLGMLSEHGLRSYRLTGAYCIDNNPIRNGVGGYVLHR